LSGLLTRRRILVTGGAKGIGLATVRRFVDEGASIVALDRDEAALAMLAQTSTEGRIHVVAADVADGTSVATAVATAADALGGLDGVVNAAGIDLIADLEAMTLAEWSRVLAVNLTGPVIVMQAALPHLRAAGGGTIVNVSSGAGLSPLKHRTR
jgi:NAD(P)-dependent dehydrogenase (short-subunit alcohol dehydrogenase family)